MLLAIFLATPFNLLPCFCKNFFVSLGYFFASFNTSFSRPSNSSVVNISYIFHFQVFLSTVHLHLSLPEYKIHSFHDILYLKK
nr:MAG TPA: hypothetical protein [Caudoviricetes sp.]